MDNKEFYADCGFYKDKLTGSIVTLCGRDVGVSYRDGHYFATDIETGLSLQNGEQAITEKECIKEAEKTIKIFETLSQDKVEKQIAKLNRLPLAEPDKITIRKDERHISGMINYKYFNSVISDTPKGLKVELEDSQLFTQEECDMIIDQLEELLSKNA